jgi:hypothetical protein
VDVGAIQVRPSPAKLEGERFMKNLFKATALMALMCGVALAQNANPSSNSRTPQPQAQTSAPQNSAQSATPGQHPTRIAPGSVIPVQLTKTVDA